MFDWLSFLQSRNISYVEHGDDSHGKSPGHGNVMVHCPWCAFETSIDYMHISLTGAGWYCFRRPEHAGKSPATLVAALLGVSVMEAKEITGQHKHIPSDFLNAVMSHFERSAPPLKRNIQLPEEFRPIISQPLVLNYLSRRGFTVRDVQNMTTDYNVRFCRRGAYSNRVIFPVTMAGKLQTWTGRTISRNETLRYMTLSTKEEKARREGYKPAIGKITDYLLWFDELMAIDADTFIITEGPFDALKVMVLGRRAGIVATCLFTNRASAAQNDLIYDLAPRFRYRYIMLDQGTLGSMLQASNRLAALKIRPLLLPSGIKDPGELTQETLLSLLRTG